MTAKEGKAACERIMDLTVKRDSYSLVTRIYKEDKEISIVYANSGITSMELATLFAAAPDMLHDLIQLQGIQYVDGREGANWGDTEYDSRSVAYGYNLAVAHLKQYLSSINKATKP